GSGDSVSVAKMGMIGTIGAALIAAVATIVSVVGGASGPHGPAVTPTLTQESSLGSISQVEVNGSGTEVPEGGSDVRDVDTVFVTVGPRPDGQRWVAYANVSDQQWKLVVPTEPHVPQPYELKAYFRQRVSGGATIQGASNSIFRRTAPTT